MNEVSCDRLRARGGWAEDAILHRCTSPIGPRNTYSNIAYAIAGFALLFVDGMQPAAAGVAWFSLTGLALGSAMYHSNKTLFSNMLDHVGMYMTFGALAVHGWAPDWPGMPYLMALTGMGLATYFVYAKPRFGMDVQLGVLFLLGAIPAAIWGDRLWLGAALVLFGMGFGAWHLDKNPTRPLGVWGHALWHKFTAWAIFCMFLAQLRHSMT
jgi:hypothetical protein